MNTQTIIDQQAFRHSDGKGGLTHSVVALLHRHPDYEITIFAYPISADGLPNISKISCVGPLDGLGQNSPILEGSERSFVATVSSCLDRGWVALSSEETGPLTIGSDGHVRASVFDYVPDYAAAIGGAATTATALAL